MSRMFDYRCLKCASWFEALVDDPIPESLECRCGGVASRRWRKAPGVVGDGEYFSTQLHRNFSSRNEYYKYCKKSGLEVLGPDEWNRTQSMPGSTPNDEGGGGINEPAMIDAMQKAWHDVVECGKTMPKDEPKIDLSEADTGSVTFPVGG